MIKSSEIQKFQILKIYFVSHEASFQQAVRNCQFLMDYELYENLEDGS